MDKRLPDNIDDFFSSHLKDYAEEPGMRTWVEIDKRLSEIEKKEKGFSIAAILSAAAIIAAGLLFPFLLMNPYLQKHPSAENKSINKKNIENNTAYNNSPINISPNIKFTIADDDAQNHEENIALNYQMPEQDFSLAKIPAFNNLNELYAADKLIKDGNSTSQIFFSDSLLNNKSDAEIASSTIIKLNKKHNIIISPFVSFDHITGRIIEQYEFDNADKSDYQKRENADMSFTGGVLAVYQLNNKFSLLSGVSISGAKLSISSTAVSALKDENGIYKFKLATSYGLAEISNSGITPAEGDSLFISDATMKFNYITFPLLVNYNFNSNKKIKLSVHGGIALNKLMSEKVEAEYNAQNGNEVETINKIEGIKRTFFTLNTGVEAAYSLNQHTSISISPELRYGINSINKGTPVKTYPINYGLALHLNIKL